MRRADAAGRNLTQAHQRLEDKRKELFYLRKALFESVASTAPKPPSYDNVTQATATPPGPSSTATGPKYAPPPGPPPAFQSRESLDKAGQKPPVFPEPETVTAGPSAAGANAASSGSTDPVPGSPPSSPRPWGTRKCNPISRNGTKLISRFV